MAFFSVEPWGCRVDDLRAGTIAASASAGFGGEPDPSKYFVREKEQAFGTWQELKAALSGYGKVVKAAPDQQ